MSKNPNKQLCQTPNCRAWAMRHHNHCRSHRDQELGPRGAGAPKGNFNALKTAANAHFLPEPELNQLGYKIAQEPEYLKSFLIQLFEDVDKVTDDPFKTMLLYSRLLQQLTPIIGNNMFTAELNHFLQRLPPSRRASFQTFIWKYALLRNPLSRLTLLRGIVNRISKKNIDGKTISGTIPDFQR